MSDQGPDILLVEKRIEPRELSRLAQLYFVDMVKYVVDLDRGIAAVGGELHADAEQILLSSGSRQAHLWGANYLPGKGPEGRIEFTALIKIRPSQGNRSMVIEDSGIRERVREITFRLIGEGEPLP